MGSGDAGTRTRAHVPSSSCVHVYHDMQRVHAKNQPCRRAAKPDAPESTAHALEMARLRMCMTVDELASLTKISAHQILRFERSVDKPDICSMKIIEKHLRLHDGAAGARPGRS